MGTINYRERKLVDAAVAIRQDLSEDDEFDQTSSLRMLNDALESYGYMRISQGIELEYWCKRTETWGPMCRHRVGCASAKSRIKAAP